MSKLTKTSFTEEVMSQLCKTPSTLVDPPAPPSILFTAGIKSKRMDKYGGGRPDGQAVMVKTILPSSIVEQSFSHQYSFYCFICGYFAIIFDNSV